MGKKVKTFLHVFVRSLIPEVDYYRKLIKTHFCFSIKYYISLILVLNLLFILFVFIRLNPFKMKTLLSNLVKSVQKYPKELRIEIRNGSLKTNYGRPYLLWLDYDDKKYLLLVVDEFATPEQIAQYRSYMLLTSNRAIARRVFLGGNLSQYSLKKFEDQTITYTTAQEVVSSFQRVIQFLPILYIGILLIFLILIPLFSFGITSLYVFLSSVVVYYFLKYGAKKSIRFRKTLQVSLHAITLPLLLDYGLIMFNLSSKSLPFLFFFLSLIFVGGGVYEAYLDYDGK